MKEKRQSIGIIKNKKAVILDVPFDKDNLLVGMTNKGVPVYLINSDNQLWPDYTGLAGQVFIYMVFKNEVIYAQEICCMDGFTELTKDKGCRIQDFIRTDEEFAEQDWQFAKVC